MYILFLIPHYPSLIYLLLVLLFGYIFWSISKNYRYVRSPAAFFWLPVLQITSDLSVILGTVMGYLIKS